MSFDRNFIMIENKSNRIFQYCRHYVTLKLGSLKITTFFTSFSSGSCGAGLSGLRFFNNSDPPEELELVAESQQQSWWIVVNIAWGYICLCWYLFSASEYFIWWESYFAWTNTRDIKEALFANIKYHFNDICEI